MLNAKRNPAAVAGTFMQNAGGNIQGSSAPVQGASQLLQGSSPQLQVTTSPMNYNMVDPAATAQPQLTPTGDTAGSGSGVSQAQLNPLLAALLALDPARETSRNRAQSDYDNITNQYADQFGIDKQKYQGEVTQNEQNLSGNRQAAMLQAAQGGQGLRAVLAAMGALNGTGSILADRAIGQAANKDIGDAQNSFETNASTLQNAWADTEAQDKQRKDQARAALDASFNSADTNFFNNKIDILGKIANAYGANTSQGLDYANKAAGLYDTVSKIPQGQAVPYTPVSSLYSPKNLSSYLAGTNNLQVKTDAGNSKPNSPSVVTSTTKRKDELN